MFKQFSILSFSVVAGTFLIPMEVQSAGEPPVLSANPGPAAVSPDARLKIGRGEDYVPSTEDPQQLFNELESSMKKRRDFGWKVVEKVLKPQKIKLLDGVTEVEVPLWHTWYEGNPSAQTANREIERIFALYLKKLKPVLDADPHADVGPVVAATMKDFSTKDLSSSLTDANFSSLLHQFDGEDVGDSLGRGNTIFSPSFVEHILEQARGIDECKFNATTADEPGPSPRSFSPCIKEFPRSAVMIKTNWISLKDGVPVHDTSGTAMLKAFVEGTWPGPKNPTPPVPKVNPARSQIYSNVSTDGTEWGLASIHFVTKDVREWVWVSLWWDPNASADFGADQPASIANFNGGVWKNYKMCVVSSFAEKDAKPWSYYTGTQQSLGDSIKAVYDAIQAEIDNGAKTHVGVIPRPAPLHLPGALGPWAAPNNEQTCWCSNPNVELHAGNARTSCIGCHQISFTKNERRNNTPAQFSDVIVGDLPQFGRVRARKNFPAEFSWAFAFEFQDAIANGKPQGFKWPAN